VSGSLYVIRDSEALLEEELLGSCQNESTEAGLTVRLTGLPAAGKTTIAEGLDIPRP
jgi:adenylylsulfate kinase-like enzyme